MTVTAAPPASLEQVIADMLSLQKALPPRPSFPELDIALDAIAKADEARAAKQAELARQKCPQGVPTEVFAILQRMRWEAEESKLKEKKSAFEAVVEIEERHRRYDEWIRRAHAALSDLISRSGAGGGGEMDEGAAQVNDDEEEGKRKSAEEDEEGRDVVERRDSARSVLDATWEFPPSASSSTPTSDSAAGPMSSSSTTSVHGHGHTKLLPGSLITTTTTSSPAIARSDSFSRIAQSLSWSQDRKQQPHSNQAHDGGKHSRMMPGGSVVTGKEESRKEEPVPVPSKSSKKDGDMVGLLLNSVDKKGGEVQSCIDISGKGIEWVPESVGNMAWLTELHLSRNSLSSLPDSISDLGCLSILDVSTNRLTALPESVGRLTSLTTLVIDNNKMEELPWTIGQCTALVELHASFNQLKALPEATGKLSRLRVLDVHWNKLGSLPSTIGSLASLTDLNASFNEIRCIPEGLCNLTSLVSVNLASNFTELQELPSRIGNLYRLKTLNLSCNQLKVLPDSFALLTNLEQLDLSENNWRFPPKYIVDQGKDAVLKFVAHHVSEKEKSKLDLTKSLGTKKKKKNWRFLFFTCGKFSVAQEKLVA